MRNVLYFTIVFAYFIEVVASVRHSSGLHTSGYLILAIANLMILLLNLRKRP